MFCSEGKIKSVLRPRMKLARIGDIWLKKKGRNPVGKEDKMNIIYF